MPAPEKHPVSDFVKEHWPVMAAAAATLAGGAILLAIKYSKHKRSMAGKEGAPLEVFENEARSAHDEAAALLETAEAAVRIEPEIAKSAFELASQVDDPELKERLLTVASFGRSSRQ